MNAGFGFSWLNLVILVAVGFVKLRKPAKDAIAQRALFMRNELSTVREQLARSKASYEEYSAKLQAIDAELRAMQEENRTQARGMAARITGEAQRLGAQIIQDARTAADAATQDFRRQLVGEFGAKIIQRVEAQVRERLTGDDRLRIRQEFSRMVEGTQ